jgi:hypothetical protein
VRVRLSAPPSSVARPVAEVADGVPDLETVPRKLGRPSLEHAPGDPRRFLVATLVAASTLLLAVLAFDVVVDPWGQLGTGFFPSLIPTDRPVKAGLVDRLADAPQLVIFGSSRALKINPTYLQRRLGQPGFNAAVSDGQPEDAWAFLNLIHSRFPKGHPHFLYMLDVEAFRGTPDPGVLDTPQLARSIPLRQRWLARAHGILPLLSWKGVRASMRVFRKSVFGNGVPLRNTVFTANGFRLVDSHDIARARGSTFADQLRSSEALYSWVYRTLYHRLSATQERYFERLLAKTNAWGEPPVIVLTPIHPAMRAVLGPLGWNVRHRQVLAYLDALSKRYRFTLLDMTSLSSFGGSPRLFYDGFHLTIPNMHRLLDTLVRKERRAL